MTYENLVNEANQHLINLLMTTHPSRETLNRLATLYGLAFDQALMLDTPAETLPEIKRPALKKTVKPQLPESIVGEVISTV